MIFKKLVKSVSQQRRAERSAELYRNLIRHEARLGGEVFGPVAPGGRREFFCLDEHTWVWHEEWLDKTGKRKIRTTRYDVRPTGILKVQDGKGYQRLSKQELLNFAQAVEQYGERVNKELYNFA